MAETESCHSPRQSPGPPVTLDRFREEAGRPSLYEPLGWISEFTCLVQFSANRKGLTSTQDNALGTQQKAVSGPSLEELTGLKEQSEACPWGGAFLMGLSVVRALGARIKVRGSRFVPFLCPIPLWPAYFWPGQTLGKLAPLPASASEPVTSPCDSLALLPVGRAWPSFCSPKLWGPL